MKASHRFLLSLGSLFFVTACSETPSLLIDLEPALAVLSGSIQATQNSGLLARTAPDKARPWLPDAFNLMPKAWAAPSACPAVNSGDVTTSYCDNESLIVFYNNCQSSGMSESGMWRSYMRLKFPSNTECTAVNTSGFTPAVVSTLVGKTATRSYGLYSGGDQNNMRLVTSSAETVYLYSDYPSGWQDDRTGGVEITWDTTDQRTMIIKGVQARSAIHKGLLTGSLSATDLLPLADPVLTQAATFIWDHTLNTIKTGDTLFSIGPTYSGTPGGAVSFADGMGTDTTAPFDGDIVVSSNTVKTGAAIRAQHNIAKGIGVFLVTEDLVWGDSTCCWPTSGTIRGEHDRNFSSATLTETLTFTGESCGSIRYTTITGESPLTQLHHCF